MTQRSAWAGFDGTGTLRDEHPGTKLASTDLIDQADLGYREELQCRPARHRPVRRRSPSTRPSRSSARTRRAHAGRVHPRPVAAAEQLGPLGDGVRGGRLHGADAGLAGRSRDGRGGEGASRGLRPQDRRAGRRPLRRGHPPARQEAGRHRALLRRAARRRSSPGAGSRPRRWRSTRRRSAACCRCRSRR